MKLAIMLFVLFSTHLHADKVELKISDATKHLLWQTTINRVFYRQCDVCGRLVPSQLGIMIHCEPFMGMMGTDHVKNKAVRKAMFPYSTKERFICMRCIYERLGIKPDWIMPDVADIDNAALAIPDGE
jgi:hypothetical protein